MFRIDEILPFLFADYKFKIIGNQTRQSLNTPVQNTTFFRKQFFSNMLVIFSAFLNLLFGKNSLSAKESIASVIIWNDILSFGSISREISAEISCLKKLVFSSVNMPISSLIMQNRPTSLTLLNLATFPLSSEAILPETAFLISIISCKTFSTLDLLYLPLHAIIRIFCVLVDGIRRYPLYSCTVNISVLSRSWCRKFIHVSDFGVFGIYLTEILFIVKDF